MGTALPSIGPRAYWQGFELLVHPEDFDKTAIYLDFMGAAFSPALRLASG
jgi:hypothetical protein